MCRWHIQRPQQPRYLLEISQWTDWSMAWHRSESKSSHSWEAALLSKYYTNLDVDGRSLTTILDSCYQRIVEMFRWSCQPSAQSGPRRYTDRRRYCSGASKLAFNYMYHNMMFWPQFHRLLYPFAAHLFTTMWRSSLIRRSSTRTDGFSPIPASWRHFWCHFHEDLECALV